MNVESFTEMMQGAVIMNSMCTGVATRDGQSVSMTEEYARSGPEPAMSMACGAAGISREDANLGMASLRLVGGTDHPEVAALDLKSALGHQTAAEPQQIGAPLPGMAQGHGPDGHGLG